MFFSLLTDQPSYNILNSTILTFHHCLNFMFILCCVFFVDSVLKLWTWVIHNFICKWKLLLYISSLHWMLSFSVLSKKFWIWLIICASVVVGKHFYCYTHNWIIYLVNSFQSHSVCCWWCCLLMLSYNDIQLNELIKYTVWTITKSLIHVLTRQLTKFVSSL